MNAGEFEKLVAEAVDGLPQNIKDAMNNVGFVIERVARRRKAHEVGVRSGNHLLGLYEGVPLIERGPYYSALPDKITIFQDPIEDESGGEPAAVKDLVAEVVWHELGHHLGFDDRQLRAIERRRKRRCRIEIG